MSTTTGFVLSLAILGCSSPNPSKIVDAPMVDAAPAGRDAAIVATPDTAVDAAGTEDLPLSSEFQLGPEAIAALPTVTCEQLLQHHQECGRIPDGGETTTDYCGGMASLQALWRPEFFATFFDCLVNHECHFDDDDCLLTAIRTTDNGLIDIAVLDACIQDPSSPCGDFYRGIAADCNQKRKDCMDDAGHTFSDERCASITALDDTGRAQVPACLALDCSEVSMCLSALGTINP